MARTKISEFSATPADNTDIDNINIAEGCAPSGINNAIRELMAQLKDFQTGAGGDPFNGAVNGTLGATTPAAATITNLAYTGTLTGGTGVINIGSGQVYKDASGNVGIGTASPSAKLQVAGNILTTGAFIAGANVSPPTADASIYRAADNTLAFATGSTERMRIDSSGNVGIGTSSPAAKLSSNVSGVGSVTALNITNDNNGFAAGTGVAINFGVASSSAIGTFGKIEVLNQTATSGSNSFMVFSTRGADNLSERMRIDSSGNLLVGTTTGNGESGVGIKFNTSSSVPTVNVVSNTAGNQNQWVWYNTDATNNGYRFYVNINGGIFNYSGNNSNLSDERTKKNIELSGGYLQKICAIPVKLFNYKDELEGEQRTLGVIAQDVEAVAPEFVNNDGWQGTQSEDGVPLKAIYTTDMMFGMMKAIQELKAEFDAYKAAHP